MPSQRRKRLRPYKPLHPINCTESDGNLRYMRDMLDVDCRSMVRFQETQDNPNFKCPPLMAAYCVKHYKCMEFLLANGANPAGMNLNRYTTMHFALHDHDVRGVEILLKYGIDPNFNSSGCGSFLSWSLGNYKITSILLSHGALTDCLIQNKYEYAFYISNLSSALRKGHVECAKLLLLYNAITDYRNIPYINPSSVYLNAFPHCVIKGNLPRKSIDVQLRMFEMLRQFGVDLYQKNKLGLTVLEVLQFQAIGDQESRVLADELKKLLSEPPSLVCLARIAIKQILGRDLLQKLPVMKELKIVPSPLISFLQFPNV